MLCFVSAFSQNVVNIPVTISGKPLAQVPQKVVPNKLDKLIIAENDIWRVMTFGDAQKYFAPFVATTALNYLPSQTGNTVNLNVIFTSSADGKKYFIDPNGNAAVLSDGGVGKTYLAGKGINFTNSNVINAKDTSATNEIQNLSLNGTALSISGGNTVTLPIQIPKNIMSNDLTANATHTQDFANFSQLWKRLRTFDVKADSFKLATTSKQLFKTQDIQEFEASVGQSFNSPYQQISGGTQTMYGGVQNIVCPTIQGIWSDSMQNIHAKEQNIYANKQNFLSFNGTLMSSDAYLNFEGADSISLLSRSIRFRNDSTRYKPVGATWNLKDPSTGEGNWSNSASGNLSFVNTATIQHSKVGNSVSSVVRDSSISLQKLAPAPDNGMVAIYVNDLWTHEYLSNLPTANYANSNLGFTNSRTHNVNNFNLAHNNCGQVDWYSSNTAGSGFHVYLDEFVAGTTFSPIEFRVGNSSMTGGKELFLKTSDIGDVQSSGSTKKAFVMQKDVSPLWEGEVEHQYASLNDLFGVDISNPQADEVLRYENGIGWHNAPPPSTGAVGLQSVTAALPLIGNGTSGDPLKIAGVLPATVPIGTPLILVNNGASSAVGLGTIKIGVELQGIGTATNPFALNQQGATVGQGLRWNGTRYAPINDAPINVSTTYPMSGTGISTSPVSITTLGATNGQVLTAQGLNVIWADPPSNVNKVIAKYSRVGTQVFTNTSVTFCKYNTTIIAPVPLTAIALDPLTGDILIAKSGKYKVDVIEYVTAAVSNPNVRRTLSIFQNSVEVSATESNYTPSFGVGTIVNVTSGDILRVQLTYSTLSSTMGETTGRYSQITITEL